MEDKKGANAQGIDMGRMKEMMGAQGGMSEMMGKCMQMFQQTPGGDSRSATMASFATPEVRGLFEEWAKALEDEITAFLKETGSGTPSQIAAKLKISEESVLFFIGKMAREGKLKITGVSL
jgi:hypothetical protein